MYQKLISIILLFSISVNSVFATQSVLEIPINEFHEIIESTPEQITNELSDETLTTSLESIAASLDESVQSEYFSDEEKIFLQKISAQLKQDAPKPRKFKKAIKRSLKFLMDSNFKAHHST